MRSEVALARLAIGVVALHVVDDNFLQPNPGTSAGDHLFGGLVPLAVLVAAAAFYGRLRAGARATIALLVGFFGVLAGTEAIHYTLGVGPSGDDYTGLLVDSRRAHAARPRRRDAVEVTASRRPALVALRPPAAHHRGRRCSPRSPPSFPSRSPTSSRTRPATTSPPPTSGAPYEEVEFTTSDGLLLKGWYIRSQNGAAVISFPGRAASQKRAKVLARHGYGVLLFDRRGEGESEGDPNLFGWQGERDVHAAVAFLQSRPDVDPERIGGIGLSVGGEMMIEAAAESSALKAIVSEGASGRSVRDELANPGGRLAGADRHRRRDRRDGALHRQRAAGRPPEPRAEDLGRGVLRLRRARPGDRRSPRTTPSTRRPAGRRSSGRFPAPGTWAASRRSRAEYERRIVGFFDRTLLGER